MDNASSVKRLTTLGWRVMRIGNVLQVKRGGSPRPIDEYITTKEDGMNWLKIGDIKKGAKYITNTSSKILKEGVKMSTKVNIGDFILSNSMSYGRPYIMNIEACIHDGWLTFQEINLNLVTRDFLYYLLTHPKTQSIFQSISAGSGVQNLKKETVSEIRLLLPPIPEQNRIVSILETWDKAIGKLTKKLSLLKDQRKFLLNNLITGAIRTPENLRTL